MHRSLHKCLPLRWLLFAGLGWLLVACGSPSTLPTSAAPTNSPEAAVSPSPTPTPTPKTLTICLGEEPQTLYLYGGNSRAMWSVLEAIYDGPVDWVNGQPQPVILERLPTRASGDVEEEAVPVQEGDEIVDAQGALVSLQPGVKVLPAGCSGMECAQTWDGTTPLQMTRLRITFHLRPDVTWSDGVPLEAQDSVYSFQVAADPQTPTSKYYSERTADYRALDARTVLWIGKPGFQPQRYADLFWIPLPRHVWGQLSPKDLLSAETSTRRPLGWGAFVIEEWEAGKAIRLRRNPLYFRATEGLPAVDVLEFRFLGDQADNNLYALIHGECDVVDRSVLLENQIKDLLTAEKEGQIRLWRILGPEWEHLDFGIRPAAYDDGYNPAAGDRPDFFGDARVRQAFALCLDRERVIREVFLGQTQVPVGFFPPDHPLYLQGVAGQAYDPQAGQRLLDEVGWLDDDGNPATPRRAHGVTGVPEGTELRVRYLTTTAAVRKQAAGILAASLAQCGIGVEVQFLEAGDLFAPGPEGPLFGRQFDLAAFAWQSGAGNPCFLYASDQIPGAENHWLGVNITGYSDPAYDQACQAALQTSPEDEEAYQTAQRQVQVSYMQALPSIPLYYAVDWIAARPDVCGLAPANGARSDFWNLESLNRGEGCR